MPKPPLSNYAAAHFRWRVADRVGFVELDRPERKNPLTFDSYAELRDLFRALALRARRARHRSLGGRRQTSAPAATCTRSSGR